MRGIKQRYSAWLKEHGLTAAPNFRALAVPVDMLDAKTVGSLAIAILNAGLKPRLIVVDTVARCFGAGDENQTRDMNAFVKGCDDLREYLGASVLAVHHTGKNAGRGARGSVALKGAADVEFLVTRGGKGLIKLQNTKQKDTEPLPDQRVQLVPVGESCAIRAADPAQAAKAEAAEFVERGTAETDDAVFFALLPFGPEGATFSQWLDGSKKRKATFDRSRKRLVAAGRVKRDGERYCCVVAPDDPAIGEPSQGEQAP